MPQTKWKKSRVEVKFSDRALLKYNKRTLALCPTCGDYGCATRIDRKSTTGNISKALPIKYCPKCNLLIILDHDISVIYEKKSTQEAAFMKIRNDRYNTNRRAKMWLKDMAPIKIGQQIHKQH